jgi:hypothetical protein
VYDPQKSARGQVAVKAIRLKDSFISLFKEGKLTGGRHWRRQQHQQHYNSPDVGDSQAAVIRFSRPRESDLCAMPPAALGMQHAAHSLVSRPTLLALLLPRRAVLPRRQGAA